MGGDYAKNRNFVIPAHPFVSRLSPAIRVRLISEKEVARIAINTFANPSDCEKFLQEVHWRTYWRSWLELRPAVWHNYVTSLPDVSRHLDQHQRNRIQQIESGESGVAPIDEFVRELIATGYLHNHARMWFAAYWVHMERLPWELGADFFERHLICACPAANTLSWRWITGLQTQGKTYLARRSNLKKYCDASYLGGEHGMDNLEASSPAPLRDEAPVLPQEPELETAFEPPNGKVGLWITEDDLTPETSQLAEVAIDTISTSVVGAPPESAQSNGRRRAYRLKAAQDASLRAQSHWGCEAHTIEAETSSALSARLIDWAKQHDVKTVVALKPFVGPTEDALIGTHDGLKAAGIELKLLRRNEDANLLPYAKRGFFHFWEMSRKDVMSRS